MTEGEFQKFASQGYTRVPVLAEARADLYTPLAVYVKLANAPYSYLLESVVGGERDGFDEAYAVIGAAIAPGPTRCDVEDGEPFTWKKLGNRRGPVGRSFTDEGGDKSAGELDGCRVMRREEPAGEGLANRDRDLAGIKTDERARLRRAAQGRPGFPARFIADITTDASVPNDSSLALAPDEQQASDGARGAREPEAAHRCLYGRNDAGE